jgi:hypothetical protein
MDYVWHSGCSIAHRGIPRTFATLRRRARRQKILALTPSSDAVAPLMVIVNWAAACEKECRSGNGQTELEAIFDRLPHLRGLLPCRDIEEPQPRPRRSTLVPRRRDQPTDQLEVGTGV